MTTTQANPAVGKSIVANGIRTNYLESGTGGQTVVLVHGSGPGVTAYANWRLVLPVLGEDFTCYAPDMVGFGYSDRPEDVEYSVQTWADQTVGFIKAMGIEKTHLIGNSFGGAIALRIATQHPELVDKIVLMGSMGVPFDITDGLDTVWGYEGTIESMRQVLDYFAYSRDLVNEELAQVRYKASMEPGFHESFSSMFPAPRQRWVEAMTTPDDEIRKLTNRTLIVHGREDKVIPLETSLKLEQLIDNADLSVFSHCGHWSMIERTADFNRLVRDFFLEAPTTPVKGQ
ncbi:alpha/beta fold hydrolase [Nakamurella sp.]|uniref:alpha/beta fold hydrolase n=1 Tax=Nakamurella sp. TaxID=1869182 RepID=UPI003B3AB86E